MKKVENFMNKRVVFFSPEDSIFDVAKIFSKRSISGAPVVRNKKVIGVISESDIVKFMSLKLGKVGGVVTSTSLMLISLRYWG